MTSLGYLTTDADDAQEARVVTEIAVVPTQVSESTKDMVGAMQQRSPNNTIMTQLKNFPENGMLSQRVVEALSSCNDFTVNLWSLIDTIPPGKEYDNLRCVVRQTSATANRRHGELVKFLQTLQSLIPCLWGFIGAAKRQIQYNKKTPFDKDSVFKQLNGEAVLVAVTGAKDILRDEEVTANKRATSVDQLDALIGVVSGLAGQDQSLVLARKRKKETLETLEEIKAKRDTLSDNRHKAIKTLQEADVKRKDIKTLQEKFDREVDKQQQLLAKQTDEAGKTANKDPTRRTVKDGQFSVFGVVVKEANEREELDYTQQQMAAAAIEKNRTDQQSLTQGMVDMGKSFINDIADSEATFTAHTAALTDIDAELKAIDAEELKAIDEARKATAAYETLVQQHGTDTEKSLIAVRQNAAVYSVAMHTASQCAHGMAVQMASSGSLLEHEFQAMAFVNSDGTMEEGTMEEQVERAQILLKDLIHSDDDLFKLLRALCDVEAMSGIAKDAKASKEKAVLDKAAVVDQPSS